MRKLIVFILAFGIASFVVFGEGSRFDFLRLSFSDTKAHGQNILSFLRGQVNPVLDEDSSNISMPKPQPIVRESRELASAFQPQFKEYAPRLSISTAHASVIMDVDSGKVLYARNADQERQVASLTKLFTATIAMEQIHNLDELVTIDEEAIYADGTRVGCPRSGVCSGVRFKVGEQVTARDLLKAALMNSANDAAIALGKHMGGTQDGFAKIMNNRAQELGLTHSHFCTPSGLEPDGRETECYSSAADIAKIAVHALEFPEIWEIMRLEKQIITSHDGKYSHEIFNTDQLLGQLPNLIGTKTGFTPLAGYSLLAVASDQSSKHKVVAVVLDDGSRWQSIRSMFDWSFEAFEWK